MAREPINRASSDGNSSGVPLRTCIGCRQRASKRELLRVTAGSDAHGLPTSPGRGAHLHPTAACYDLAVRRKAFARALRHEPGVEGGLSTAPVGEWLDSHIDKQ